MPHNNRLVLLGGHGKIALQAIPRLTAAGYTVDAVIRNADHTDAVKDAGADPIVLDLEKASQAQLADLFTGATAVVFSAGAGGGGTPERTHAVDHDSAVRSMLAAGQAGVSRYVMVSYVTAASDINRLSPDNAFFPYAKAKHDADAYLRQTTLDYTILGPARLTDTPPTGCIERVDQLPADWPEARRVTSRGNVAAVIAHVVANGVAIRQTVNFLDGDVAIDRAIPE